VGLWQNIKVRLGLEDDWDEDYYEDDEGYHDPDEDEQPRSSDGFYGRTTYETPHAGGTPGVRRLERQADTDRARSADRGRVHAAPVTPMTPQVKMHIVEPKSFTEAQSIADRFKQGIPVIMNMTMTQPDLAKRLIDFASGLTYGLDGGLQKVSEKVFMLTPTNVDVSAGDAVRRMRDNGVFSVDG
jgi:cell division inhibitor SepF